MAPTLITSVPYHNQAPPTSPSLQMPNVFVVPPEEEDTPAWCCFDATQPHPLESLMTSTDLNFLENRLSVFQTESDTPILHRNASGPFPSHIPVTMPKKNVQSRSIIDAYISGEYPESDDEDMDIEQEPPRTIGGSGNDSEIVEIIKLRRQGEDSGGYPHALPTHTKSSKSLKSRASKAFRSLRNVGKSKGSLRVKPKAEDIFTSGSTAPPSQTPTIARRSSAVFSQLFSPPATLDSPSSSSSEERDATKLSLALDQYRSSSSLEGQPCYRRPDSPLNHASDLDRHDSQGQPPTLSVHTKSNRRRFSMMSLQRIFSFSGDECSDATPSYIFSDSAGPSTASSSGPETPTDESNPLPLQFDGKNLSTSSTVPMLRHDQISFEMRLDSLHFDSLSFDADEF
ncbi:hypothetical protein H0H81_000475 [Sphagnurus paluster]|uniref:Uncharacterized protein n=1 Tax=Sphagnurus paluster TaxID=117069 RepID=A0A9P7GIY3_9AGAR|nr:hypothetical protein H0H81_000475 [Sphagnurus paluster]